MQPMQSMQILQPMRGLPKLNGTIPKLGTIAFRSRNFNSIK